MPVRIKDKMASSIGPDGMARFQSIVLNERCNKNIYNKKVGTQRQVEPCITRKHAYSNILKFLQPKKENFQIKILIIFIFLFKAQIVNTR